MTLLLSLGRYWDQWVVGVEFHCCWAQMLVEASVAGGRMSSGRHLHRQSCRIPLLSGGDEGRVVMKRQLYGRSTGWESSLSLLSGPGFPSYWLLLLELLEPAAAASAYGLPAAAAMGICCSCSCWLLLFAGARCCCCLLLLAEACWSLLRLLVAAGCWSLLMLLAVAACWSSLLLVYIQLYSTYTLPSVAEPEPVEPKLIGDLEPEPKINLNKHFLQSVWRMLGRRKAKFYLY